MNDTGKKHCQITFWLEHAKRYVEAKQWDLALIALTNAQLFVERDHPNEAATVRAMLKAVAS